MARKLPPLNAIRAFEAAARFASFTKAADELHVTHGAISQQIKLSEEFYNKPLFVRSKGRVSLNEDGLLLLPVVSDALESIEDVSAKIFTKSLSEILTINLTSAFAAQWLMPRLVDFQQAYPDITIRLAPTSSFSGFKESEADVSIRWGRGQENDNVMVKLFDVDAFAACAPELLSGPNPIRYPSDLVHHTFLHDDDGAAWHTWLLQAGVEGLESAIDTYFSDSALALQAAVEGQGLITAGSILAARDLAAGRLVIPFDVFMRNRNAYYLSYPKDIEENQKIVAFKDWIGGKVSDYLEKRIAPDRYVVKN